MSLTEAGVLYYERIAQVLDDLEGADAAIAPMQDAPKGLLRVSAPVTVTLTCLSQAIPGFLARYPELSLDLRMEDRRVDIVEEGFDLAIRGSDRLEDSSLIPRIYVEEDLAAGRLVSVLDDWTPVATTIYAVYPSRRYLQAKLRAFLDFLVQELTDQPIGDPP